MNRVQDVLRRVVENCAQSEAMKTCFGILAIMSRDDSNKLIIAKDGMESILNAMTSHVDKTDVQESGCDLLWSLAFNSAAVKEIIAKNGGPSVIVRALKRHCRSAEFLKSACGALSNMCQSKLNQDGIAAQGGLQPLVGSIHAHQSNSKLLPFIFDALASLIVSNEENARAVSSLGLIPLIVASIGRHKTITEVVKSGCHALAILSDVKGQASKIAFAGGVPIILLLLDLHPGYADLHRVAAVVLLRMLQESAHVGREITCNEGIRILLKSLEKGGSQHDTVAAVTHILFTVTNTASPASMIESQLWLQPAKSEIETKNRSGDLSGSKLSLPYVSSAESLHNVTALSTNDQSHSALGGLVAVMAQYCDRRDVIRAACRLLNNLGVFPGVVNALDRLNILEIILECVSIHTETRDVIDSTAIMMKSICKRRIPLLLNNKQQCVMGVLLVFKNKMTDDDTVVACLDILLKHHESVVHAGKKGEMEKKATSSGESWETTAIGYTLQGLAKLIGIEEEEAGAGAPASIKSSVGGGRKCMSKQTLKTLSSLVNLIETLMKSVKQNEALLTESKKIFLALQDFSPVKNTDLSKKIDIVVHVLLSKASIGDFNKEISSNNTTKSEDTNSSNALSSSGKPAAESRAPTKAINNNKTDSEGGQSNRSIDKNGKAASTVISNNNEFWVLEVDERNPDGQNRRLLPRHPLKYANESARLLECWPNFLERLNNPSVNRSFSNFVMGNTADRMYVCYEGGSAAGKGVYSRVVTPVPYTVPGGQVGEPFDHSLSFDSEFESGNLMRAVQRADNVYDLFLRADLHTAGHTQWFYFAVSNTHPAALVRLSEQGVQVPPTRVKFNIVNLTKPDSLFNLGMRPVVYSCHDAAHKGYGWLRGGSDVSYYANPYPRNNTAGEGLACYYTLSFTIEFAHAKDTILVAYSYPHTVGDYRAHLRQITSRPNAPDIIRSSKLCATLGGDDCDLLVISNFKDKEKERIGPIFPSMMDGRDDATTSKKGKNDSKDKSTKLKPCLFISCRVHPGETPASWMMKGMLDFLTSDTSQAVLLRQVFVIFIVPVLNPDGVTYGNNRCSLAGVDLNRQWKLPLKGLHPTVFSLKTFMVQQRRIRDINMYIDLHGHSRKYNVFMYGCDDKKKPRPQIRAFPRFFSMHVIGQKYVSFADCSFNVKKGRESTARVVVSKEMNIPCSFTLEATFCGADYGPLKHCHMNIGHLQEVGAALCDAILNFSISEGHVKDAMTVPNNVKSVIQIEHAIAIEDGTISSSRSYFDRNKIDERDLIAHEISLKKAAADAQQQATDDGSSTQKPSADVESDSDAGGDTSDTESLATDCMIIDRGDSNTKKSFSNTMPSLTRFGNLLPNPPTSGNTAKGDGKMAGSQSIRNLSRSKSKDDSSTTLSSKLGRDMLGDNASVNDIIGSSSERGSVHDGGSMTMLSSTVLVTKKKGLKVKNVLKQREGKVSLEDRIADFEILGENDQFTKRFMSRDLELPKVKKF